MNNLDKLNKTLAEMTDNRIPVTLVWAVTESVDWTNKKMIATGVMDDLPFYDVSLGLGNKFIKPAPGSRCILGLIQNNAAAAILIDCNEAEEIELMVGNLHVNAKSDKLTVKNTSEDMLTLMLDLVEAILDEKHMTNVGPTINLTPGSVARFESLKIRFKNILNDE